MTDQILTQEQIEFLTRFIGVNLSSLQAPDEDTAANALFDDEVTGANPLYEDGNGGETDTKPKGTGNKDKSEKPKADAKPDDKQAAKQAAKTKPEQEQKPKPDVKDRREGEHAESQKPEADAKPKPVFDMKRLSKSQTSTLAAIGKLDAGVHDSLVDTLALLGQEHGLSLARADHPKVAQAALTALEDRETAQLNVNDTTNKLERAEANLAALRAKKVEPEPIAEAEKVVAAAKDTKVKAEQALKDKRTAHNAAQTRLQDIADQRLLIDQINHRMNTVDDPLDPEDAKRLVESFAKNPAAVKTAFEQIDKVPPKDRKSFVAHVETAVTALRALAPGPENAHMAANAVLMGALGGPEYTDGFAKYYKTERPTAADPSGGLDDAKTDTKEESTRIANVSKARTALLAQAVLQDPKSDAKDKGVTLVLDSEAAQNAMADLQFHPGALKTFTPALTGEALAMKKVCIEKKADIEQRLRDCTAPTEDSAIQLVRNALVLKDTDVVGEKQTQLAVMSAMFSPIAQGAVGSCASTAPLVAAKTNRPLDVMDRLVEVASKGTFTPTGRDAIPANTAFAADAGNDLNRSLEFSVATASANLDNSVEMIRLRKVVSGQQASGLRGFFSVGSPGEGLMSVSGVKWAESAPKKTPQAAISEAISKHLRVGYDAVSDVQLGDGRSSKGGHKLHFTPDPTKPHEFKVIESEAAFKEAMATIALNAYGLTKDSPEGKNLVAKTASTTFSTEVPDTKEPFKPWDIGRAPGFFPQTTKVLSGEDITVENMLGPSRDKKTSGERVETVLSNVMKNFGSSADALTPMSTQGENAQHGFNYLKDGPGQELVTGNNSVKSFAKASREKVTMTKLSVDKADDTFYAMAQRALKLWENLDHDALQQFMTQAPGKEMTLAELHAYTKAKLEPVIEAMIKKRAATRAAKPGEKKSLAELEKEQANTITGALISEIDAVMLETNPPQFVTIANTNWGGPERRDFFVVAADPSTGDLRLWIRREPDGKMRAADSYALAAWQERKPVNKK